jgi:hypothetical protein
MVKFHEMVWFMEKKGDHELSVDPQRRNKLILISIVSSEERPRDQSSCIARLRFSEVTETRIRIPELLPRLLQYHRNYLRRFTIAQWSGVKDIAGCEKWVPHTG